MVLLTGICLSISRKPGFTGKLTEIHGLSHHDKHRTTLGHFLKNGAWNEHYLLELCQQRILRKMQKQLPVFVLLDNTISQKIKPSSQALRPTESCAFHFSHTEGKSVWGHQVLQVMLKSDDQAYPYESRLYYKEKTEIIPFVAPIVWFVATTCAKLVAKKLTKVAITFTKQAIKRANERKITSEEVADVITGGTKYMDKYTRARAIYDKDKNIVVVFVGNTKEVTTIHKPDTGEITKIC